MSLLRQIYCINHKKGDFIMKKFSVLTSRTEAVDFLYQTVGGRYDADHNRFYPDVSRWLRMGGYDFHIVGHTVTRCSCGSSKLLRGFGQTLYDVLSQSYIDMESMSIISPVSLDKGSVEGDYRYLCQRLNTLFFFHFGLGMEDIGEVFMDIDECIRQYQTRSRQVQKEIA